MHLQKFLHLPSTRQRNDGHHENQFEASASPVIFPTHELKVLSLHPVSRNRAKRKNRLFKTAVLALTLAASTVAPQVFNSPAAQAKPTSNKPVGTWGRTVAASSYIRIRPGTQTPVVAKVPRGMQIMVWGTFDGWYRVETTDHKFGWMRHNTIRVPRSGKLQELSRAKAKKASDRTGNQTLYGKPEQLKTYYSKYKAPGAAKGLKKQGINVAQKPKAAPVKVVKAPVRQTAVARPIVFSPGAQSTPSTRQPDMSEVTIITAEPKVVKPVKATVQLKPQAAKPAAKPAAKKVERVQGTYSVPSKGGQITAADIMRERERHIKSKPASRHKTRPTPAKTPDSVIKTAPKGKPVAKAQPTAGSDVLNAQPKPIYGQAKVVAPAAKAVPSRGGSPRDYARVAKANNKFGDGMASQALTYRGMPYISGSASPKRGFDCSGLVYYLLRSRGYNPPRTAAGFASYGKSVPRNQLQAGDLVLFANTYKRGVSHIGVYTGNNNFVHAANSRSGVKSDSLSSGYYAKKYYGARRVK